MKKIAAGQYFLAAYLSKSDA